MDVAYLGKMRLSCECAVNCLTLRSTNMFGKLACRPRHFFNGIPSCSNAIFYICLYLIIFQMNVFTCLKIFTTISFNNKNVADEELAYLYWPIVRGLKVRRCIRQNYWGVLGWNLFIVFLWAGVDAQHSELRLLVKLVDCIFERHCVVTKITNVELEVFHRSFGRMAIRKKQALANLQQLPHSNCFLNRQVSCPPSISCSDLVIITPIKVEPSHFNPPGVFVGMLISKTRACCVNVARTFPWFPT